MEKALRLQFHDLMVKARALELRLISMVKSGEGHFWIGGPGEEAFCVALGLQVKKGEGPQFDYLLPHYRNTGLMVALGIPTIDPIRLMRSTSTDPYSRGRTFSGHYAYRPYNVIPVTSPIGTQFSVAPGLALAQKRLGGGITVVIGGDAGAAEPDFATGMIWATRPGRELPILFVVTDNEVGVSTRKRDVWAMANISDRAKPFGIKTLVFDGNDADACFQAVAEGLAYVRTERRPFMLEAKVSRLYGHSSSSGANRENSPDCLPIFEERLMKEGLLTRTEIDAIHARHHDEALQALEQVREEPLPEGHTLYDFTFAPSDVDLIWGKGYQNPNQAEEN